MKQYVCECGKSFTDVQKFNGHKSHCQIHHQSVGKEYSMEERITKQKNTVISKYGSAEEYSKQQSKKIKESFKNRTDTVDYVISNISKIEFINDYIKHNKPRTYMKEKYNIPSDYMMDAIVKRFDCKKSKKQSARLSWETKYHKYPEDNINNWKKGHLTRAEHSGTIQESYRLGLEKQRKTMLEKYGTECILNDASLITHRKKKMTGPNIKFASILDKNNIDYIQEFVVGLKSYDFKVGDNLIEINPTPTHNSYHLPYPPYKGLDSDYHLLKSQIAHDAGYRCIHVWDWDSIDKVIQLIKDKQVIYGRKCTIQEISKDISDNFCNQHHLQGSARDSIRIGLLYNNELVSVMTFGKPRYNKNYEYELIRYCSSANVIGGSKKLFAYFTRKYNPNSIISYCDNSKFEGATYKNLGFTFDAQSVGRHWYNIRTGVHITDNLLRQRGFDQLLGDTYGCFGKGTSNEQLMYAHGFVDIYDAGQSRYVWHR